jgi:urate oxidase
MSHTITPLANIRLAQNRYGKSRVRLMRVTRHEQHHDLDEWTVEVLLSGDFESAHTEGDNTKILPTDTMKNTVYFVARQSEARSIEDYAKELVDYLLERNPQVSCAEVNVQAHLWKRLTVNGKPYPTAFMRGSDERQTTSVSREQGGAFQVRSGLINLTLLKTAQSGFVGYIKDKLTTLPETTDRLFGTAVQADWPYTGKAIAEGIDFNKVRAHLRETMIATFARHDSLSVQQTMYAMGEAALRHTDIVEEVHLVMPNKHNLLVDLGRFGLDNPNHIFVPTDEPHGTIEAIVRRA